MQQQIHTTRPAGGQAANGDTLRELLRGITAEELRGFGILWQRQHDADQQGVIEAEREQLERELEDDNAELALLKEKLTKLQAGDPPESSELP